MINFNSYISMHAYLNLLDKLTKWNVVETKKTNTKLRPYSQATQLCMNVFDDSTKRARPATAGNMKT